MLDTYMQIKKITYTPYKDGEEVVYLGDLRTLNVLGKGIVLLGEDIIVDFE